MYNSALSVFYAPSDLSGIGGMRHERIRSVKSWYNGALRRNSDFVGNTDSDAGFEGLLVARVFLFSFFQTQGHHISMCPRSLVFNGWRQS